LNFQKLQATIVYQHIAGEVEICVVYT